MKIFRTFLLVAGLFIVSAHLAAQDDPFADSSASGKDPLASSHKARRQLGMIDCNEVNERIRETLSHGMSLTFNETPLIEAIREMRKTHEMTILVDGDALEKIGMSEEEPITISANNDLIGQRFVA